MTQLLDNMEQTKLERLVDLWDLIQQVQHQIQLENGGEIPKDDPRMWQQLMDHFTNETYQGIFDMLDLYLRHNWVKPHQQRLIDTAKEYYRKGYHTDPGPGGRCMDRNAQHKQPQWGLLMAMREIWDDIAKRYQ